MGGYDHPSFLALSVLWIGAAMTAPDPGPAPGLDAGTARLLLTTGVEKHSLVEQPIGGSLGAAPTPSASSQAARESGYSAEGVLDPAIVTDGVNFVEGIIAMIDDDYPFQCVCKSSKHYLSKMFNRQIPHDVSITLEVRAVLEDWLSKTNHGTTTYQSTNEQDLLAFQAKLRRAEQSLWGAGSALLEKMHLRPTSFAEVDSRSRHRVSTGLLQTLFGRSTARQSSWSDDEQDPYQINPEYLSKQYNNYNYKIRDGYCEKDTSQPCFPVPGASATLGLLAALVAWA